MGQILVGGGVAQNELAQWQLAHRLKLTPDGSTLIAAGLHAPRIRVYDLANMSMKFERHLDAEVVDLDGPLLLSRDREPGLSILGSMIEPPPPELWG